MSDRSSTSSRPATATGSAPAELARTTAEVLVGRVLRCPLVADRAALPELHVGPTTR